MNITLIRSINEKNSTTYNSAEYLISKLENVDKVYEFTFAGGYATYMLRVLCVYKRR